MKSYQRPRLHHLYCLKNRIVEILSFSVGLFSRIEYTARTSESSEEFLEEEPEQRVTEFEEESSDKDAQPALDTQPRLDKQDGDKV